MVSEVSAEEVSAEAAHPAPGKTLPEISDNEIGGKCLPVERERRGICPGSEGEGGDGQGENDAVIHLHFKAGRDWGFRSGEIEHGGRYALQAGLRDEMKGSDGLAAKRRGVLGHDRKDPGNIAHDEGRIGKIVGMLSVKRFCDSLGRIPVYGPFHRTVTIYFQTVALHDEGTALKDDISASGHLNPGIVQDIFIVKSGGR